MEEEMMEQQPIEETEEKIPASEEADVLEEHILALMDQGKAFREKYPDFDLEKELATDPDFYRLTSPIGGIQVDKAYFACHMDEILADTAKRARDQVITAIKAGALRPLEAGISGQGPSLTSFSYRSASKEQRDAFKKSLRQAWGRGETVYPQR